MKYFAVTVSLIIFVAVAAGFFVIGSPQKERLRRFDERRVQDLQMIQSEIINYWQNKNQLPLSLENLRDDIRGFAIPTDPQTKSSYTYQIKNQTSLIFELCAIFALLNETDRSYGENWQHDAGPTCFERKIDPEIYRPREKFDNKPL